MSPEHKEASKDGPFARTDVRRSQSDRSCQRPVEMRKKNGAFPKLRRSRHSKEITEVPPPVDKKTVASAEEVTNDFIISDDAGIDLDEGNKEIIPVIEDMDPGYETLDEVREKMKNLKLKKLQEEHEVDGEGVGGKSSIQTHRRTQSTGQQDEARASQNEFEITPRERMGMNSSHNDVNRPSSQHLDSRSHLLPNLASNLLSVRSGSCPLHSENSLQTPNMGSPNKSENCLSQGGVVWKDTEDVYANPSIVHKKSKYTGDMTREVVRSNKAINREESLEKEPPPLPERQYSVQTSGDTGSEAAGSEEDSSLSLCLKDQTNMVTQETNSEAVETRLDSLMMDEGSGYSTCGATVRQESMEEDGGGYSSCGAASLAPIRRRERIYEEIKDQDIDNSQCEEDNVSSVPYQSYVRKERPYEEVKDLQMDSGIHNSSSGSDFFAQVMNHFDSLSENVVSSAGICGSCTDNLETDCCESDKTSDKTPSLNEEEKFTSSSKTDSAINDLSISFDCPVSNINSLTSFAEQQDSEQPKTLNHETVKQSEFTDCQLKSTPAATGCLESGASQVNSHTESLPNSLTPVQHMTPLETSYEDDADLVLENLQSQTVPSCVSSIENLLDYERSTEEEGCSKEGAETEGCSPMTGSGVKNWEEIPYADADGPSRDDCPTNDGYSECSDVLQRNSIGSLVITETDLVCNPYDHASSASETTRLPAQSEINTSACKDVEEVENVDLQQGAMGGDPKTEKVETVTDEEGQVIWRSKGLPYKSIPSFYYDEEPVHMSLSELGMTEKFNKQSREKEKQKKREKEEKASSFRQQSSGSSSQVKVSNSGVKVRDSSFRQTAVHKNPESRRTYPMGMAKSLESDIVHKHEKDQVESKMSRSATSSEKPLRDVKAKSSFVEPITLPEIPKFNQNSELRCRKDFLDSMKQLKDCGWYWGPLSWDEAEIKLLNKPDGSFLVRDSSDERYILSLSFNMNGHVHHTRIEHHKGKFSFWSQPDSLGKSTIKEFIEQCVRNSRNGQFLYFIRPSGPGAPPMPVHLLHPVSRFRQMQSLQHMCRFQILQIVRRDHIDRLPIPRSIKDYLRQSQYYVEYLED